MLIFSTLLGLALYFEVQCKGSGGGRGGGGGGGGGRGSSGGGSRGSSGGGSSRGGSSSGGRGSSVLGRGSFSNSHSNGKTIAAGLAGGYVGYQGAKLARTISSGSSSMYYPAYSRTYYFGNRYYTSTSENTCRYVIDSDDDIFDLTYADDKVKVTEVYFNCNSNQYCCDGLDCCDGGIESWAIALIVIAVAIIIALIIFLIVRRCKQSNRKKLIEKSENLELNNPVIQENTNATGAYQIDVKNGFKNENTYVSTYQSPAAQPYADQNYHCTNQQPNNNDFLPNYAQLGFQNPNVNFGSGINNQQTLR